MSQPINRQVLLVRRPEGTPRHEDFRLADAPVPVAEPCEMLLRNLTLSLDPYMRGRMKGQEGSYAPSYALDAPPGGGTVARVVATRHSGFAVGDLVMVPHGGWQSFVVSDGTGLRRLARDVAQPSRALGILGMTGFTAWWGLTAIGAPRPARRWWFRPPPGRSAPSPARSRASSAAASSASRAAPPNAGVAAVAVHPRSAPRNWRRSSPP